ncbi:uncharacterized protein LOC113873250 isoform X2 [Abrus precatorius]|uniref:Uncharacterized protein LOC113873250 isoform X2 n=1 Tax=Abrus precatorius TaxID=3816 RepID=A0A8B8MEU9_ABRPR|nr:uncharacterized protein LOC113873250 isoform X2 [Abrus precatorius]
MPYLPTTTMSVSVSVSIAHNLKPTISVLPSHSLHHPSSFPLRFSFKAPIFCSNPSVLTRRLFLPSVSGIWDALTGGNNNAREAVLAIRRGMSLFRQVCFPKFEEGAEQFRLDVAQNPNDTEESIWCYLCEAQLYGVEEAKKRYLVVGKDPRPVMREAYNMFKDGGDPEKLVAAFSSSRESDYFYSSLYAGLYYESQNETDAAKVHIVAACQSSYGQRSDDYMASLSKVHCLCRNWV